MFGRIVSNTISHFLPLPYNKSSLYRLSMMETQNILVKIKQAIPPLSESRYKGQAGRIGIIGGSREYTGAPYFAAISALRVGCDLSHVFCTSESSQVIKSYSPELIVHPVLDEENAFEEFLKWLPRLHSLVIGPGLGRDPQILSLVERLIYKAREDKKQLVIDADGLWLVTTHPDVVKNYSSAVLTPNAMEFIRLYKKVVGENLALNDISKDHIMKLAIYLGGVTINAKGKADIITDGENVLQCETSGSLRRCGGQGDLLSGSMGTFLHWMHSYTLQDETNHGAVSMKATLLASYGASCLTRKCSNLAFRLNDRHMTTSDMIDKIPQAFSELFR